MSDQLVQLKREVRLLRAYVLGAVLGIAIIGLTAFRRTAAPTRFDEIDVQRINIREPDGKLRMVLSNKARSTGPVAYGKAFGYPGGTRPGIIFFNDEETEDGGLVFHGKTEDGKYDAGAQLSFDQYNHDQVMTLAYVDRNGDRTVGLEMGERRGPMVDERVGQLDSIDKMQNGAAKDSARRALFAPINGAPQFAPRVFVGRRDNGNAAVVLMDGKGRPRLRFIVDSLGSARIEFLNDSNRVVRSLAP
ncbi:MAG TPA: hypothetical protein VN706_01650 [Gemmatimonadaceae bacterium]|nr:hypothetical protein [Gemmatimonadaceae bacterium]